MDLISKKAAVSRIADLLILQLKGKRIPTWNEVYNAIEDIPSVPAVPLDKLCEWLADELHVSADCGIDHCDNCDAYDGTLSVKVCWMKLIKEQVMEEHNGTDNP